MIYIRRPLTFQTATLNHLTFSPRGGGGGTLQELNSSLVDRDRALCERNELLEKYCHEVRDKAEAQKELGQACRDVETVRQERDVARKERTEAIVQRDQLLREYYQARQVGPGAKVPPPRAVPLITF